MPRPPCPPIDDLARSFLNRVRWADSTKRLAHQQLNHLARWAAPRRLCDLTERDLDQYLAERKAQVSQATLASFVTTLRKFYRWAAAEGDIAENPTRRINAVVVADQPQRDVSQSEHRRMVDACNVRNRNGTRTLDGVRAEAILELMWSTGIRRGELRLLDRESYDPVRRTLVVVAPKTRTVRRVGFSDDAQDALDRYLRRRRDSGPALFVTADGERVSTSTVTRIVAHAGLKGIGRRVGCHEYRRAFAMWWLGEGGTQAGLEASAGWRPGSRQTRRYSARKEQDLAIAEGERLRQAAAQRSKDRRRRAS
jgi:integrase/recombinase XerD